MHTGPNPPRFAARIFRLMFPDDGFETTVCDLEEDFHNIVAKKGIFAGKAWYWWQALTACCSYIAFQIQGGFIMFRHQLKILLRNLKRHKSYSFINIFGLAVSFAVVIFITLFIKNELSFDHGNEHLDRMYTVMMGGEEGQQHIISAAALELSENIPEIDKYTRISLRSDYALLHRGKEEGSDTNVMIKGMRYAWVDPEMFEVFTYRFEAGDPETVLDEPNSIVLTKDVAESLFGRETAVGKVLTLNNRYDLTVTGVVAKPRDSHLDLDVFASILTLRAISGPDADRDYIYNSEPTYMLLPKEHDLGIVNQKIDAHMAAVFKRVGRDKDEFSLYPVKNIYLSNIHFQGNHGSKMLIWILVTIATFISIVAGINFINLSTARASLRAGEIGIKKVIGVMRKNLVLQLLGESLFMTPNSAWFRCWICGVIPAAAEPGVPSGLDLAGSVQSPDSFVPWWRGLWDRAFIRPLPGILPVCLPASCKYKGRENTGQKGGLFPQSLDRVSVFHLGYPACRHPYCDKPDPVHQK